MPHNKRLGEEKKRATLSKCTENVGFLEPLLKKKQKTGCGLFQTSVYSHQELKESDWFSNRGTKLWQTDVNIAHVFLFFFQRVKEEWKGLLFMPLSKWFSHSKWICHVRNAVIFSHIVKKRDSYMRKKKKNRSQIRMQVWFMETRSQRSLSSLQWQRNIFNMARNHSW